MVTLSFGAEIVTKLAEADAISSRVVAVAAALSDSGIFVPLDVTISPSSAFLARVYYSSLRRIGNYSQSGHVRLWLSSEPMGIEPVGSWGPLAHKE